MASHAPWYSITFSVRAVGSTLTNWPFNPHKMFPVFGSNGTSIPIGHTALGYTINTWWPSTDARTLQEYHINRSLNHLPAWNEKRRNRTKREATRQMRLNSCIFVVIPPSCGQFQRYSLQDAKHELASQIFFKQLPVWPTCFQQIEGTASATGTHCTCCKPRAMVGSSNIVSWH